MKLIFDDSVKIAGIGMVPSLRLGPEKWFKDYKIASLYDWDTSPGSDAPEVFSLAHDGIVPDLKKMNTTELLKHKEFQAILEDRLSGYALLTYKPVTTPKALQHRKFLMVNKSVAEKFENKVYFRQKFAEGVAVPSYEVYDRAELDITPEQYEKIMGGRNVVVLQDEQLSGGKGTFIISSYEEYQTALKTLAVKSSHRRIIVSELIKNARERSIQACVTRHGIFTGPLQRQIVRHPLLASDLAGAGDKFCGAQIVVEDQDTIVHIEAKRVAQLVGAELYAQGYKGIFGIDFLLGEDDTLYAIEANPRLTGVTPLLNALFAAGEHVPFYALHLLELADIPYQIDAVEQPYSKRDGAMLLMHSLSHQELVLKDYPKSGTYTVANGQLRRVSDNTVVTALADDEWVVQAYMPKNAKIRPGGRTMVLTTNRSVIDKTTDMLYDETNAIIHAVHAEIITESV